MANHDTLPITEFNGLFIGTVTISDPKRRVLDVTLDQTGMPVVCQYVSDVCGAQIFPRMAFLPAVGTRVLCFNADNRWFAMGNLPAAEGVKDVSGVVATVGGASVRTSETKMQKDYTNNLDAEAAAGDSPPPADALSGELMLQDAMGCGIRLLFGLAQLTGGGRALVEASVLNDMVRIVSDVFSNMSAFGEHTIYRDGNRLNVRWEGTSYDHESWGLYESTEAKTKLDAAENANKYCVSTKEEDVQKARTRFEAFLGHLGDFVNLIVHDPITAADKFASGRARVNLGNDGHILMQSVKSITMERCTRILVPKEAHAWNDPAGTKGPDWDALPGDPLKPWEFTGDLFENAFYLRQQARWLSSYASYARFWQNSQGEKADWKMPSSDEQIPQPSPSCEEKDREQESPAKFIETYQVITLTEDGSIVILDGYGSVVHLGGGDVRISASRNMHLTAGGSIIMEAGQDVQVQARRNVEILAREGGANIVSKAYMDLTATDGTLSIVGGGRAGGDKLDPEELKDTKDPLYRILGDYGVRIKAARAGVYVEARRKILVDLKRNFIGDKKDDRGDHEDSDGVQVTSALDVKVEAKMGNIGLNSKRGSIVLLGMRGMIGKGRALSFDISGDIAFGKSVVFRQSGSIIHARGFVGDFASINDVRTSTGKVGKKQEDPDPESVTVDYKPNGSIKTDRPDETVIFTGYAGEEEKSGYLVDAPGVAGQTITIPAMTDTIDLQADPVVTEMYQNYTEQWFADANKAGMDDEIKDTWKPAEDIGEPGTAGYKPMTPKREHKPQQDYNERLDMPAQSYPTTPGGHGMTSSERNLTFVKADSVNYPLVADDLRMKDAPNE
jgi:hypothetical protein